MSSQEQHTSTPRKRKHTEHSDELRTTIVYLRERGDSWAQIEAATGVCRSTAQDIVRVQRTEGRTVKKAKRIPVHKKYGDEVRAAVVCAQEKDAVLRLRDLASEVKSTLAITPPSLPTLSRILQQEGFTTKQLQQYANARSTPATKQKRKEWVELHAASLSADTAIFIDETPFSFNIMRHRGRSKKGEKAVGVVPAIRGRNHTVIAALSPSRGLLHYEIHVTAPTDEFINKKSNKTKKTAPKGVDRERFRTFLIHLFSILASSSPSSPSTPFVLLFDNARIHTGDIEDTIFQTGYTQLRLPAWSPELNPIEYAFSKWKLDFRARYPATEAAVDEAIKQSAKSITSTDSLHYFQHTQALYARTLDLEDL